MSSFRRLPVFIFFACLTTAAYAQYNPQGGRTSAEEATKQREHDDYIHLQMHPTSTSNRSSGNAAYVPSWHPSNPNTYHDYRKDPPRVPEERIPSSHPGALPSAQDIYEIHYTRAATWGGDDARWIGDYCLREKPTGPGPCSRGAEQITDWYWTSRAESPEGEMKWAARVYEGIGAPQDKDNAVYHMQRASDRGYKPAATWLVAHSIVPDITPGSELRTNLAKADLSYANPAASLADKNSAAYFYYLYRERSDHAQLMNAIITMDTNQDKEMRADSLKIIQSMNLQGYTEAKSWLANEAFKNQMLLNIDIAAANTGDLPTTLHLADAYYGGIIGVPQDHAEARKYYCMAADRDPSADLKCGIMEYMSDGGPVSATGLVRIRKEAKAKNQAAITWLKDKGIKK